MLELKDARLVESARQVAESASPCGGLPREVQFDCYVIAHFLILLALSGFVVSHTL